MKGDRFCKESVDAITTLTEGKARSPSRQALPKLIIKVDKVNQADSDDIPNDHPP
jgi:hypothetical protein